ncbi:NAD(P)/FAD-dependent oxidoreductase [Erythrobacter sp. LQ02-29]|uniref:NAD(P)/FAD-dependent oxidoreductase n=1 Tax=Erythrobacter sp. LQ02-29 TaxID=2920384 RepID=UPI001F4E17AC|nr:NAD(P)/FAD-dependent oxidoreductase [Erythrobacter sp. LQ02-29]MCP9222038.1 NAD(P)/FAD-dependent oxidoreductase [Erythrobacter sp. LQ02-29]
MDYDAIILGGGAAGLFCAAIAGQRGRRVLVLERSETVGRKILISGGGRCNFTNLGTGPENYLSANPHFAKSALARYTPRDFLDLIERYGIAWHEKTLGQLFCDGSARQIVDMLVAECDKGGVEIVTGAEVSLVEAIEDGYHVSSHDASYRGAQLVIATGGPSIPKMGASDFAYRLARQFGLKIVEPRPALVPLVLGGEEVLFRELSGVSAPVETRSGPKKGRGTFREAALFTHRGLSGPAILQASSYWRPGEPVDVDFVPDAPDGWLIAAKAQAPRKTAAALLAEHLPQRLAETLADRLGLDRPLGETTDKVLRAAETRLANWRFTPSGSEGFAKAEVTAGGIATTDLSSQTLGAKRVPGLYAIGEAVDVTGWLGGYNFQWAWASGYACGQAL